MFSATVQSVNGVVRALDFNGTSLYVGGGFSSVGPSIASEKSEEGSETTQSILRQYAMEK